LTYPSLVGGKVNKTCVRDTTRKAKKGLRRRVRGKGGWVGEKKRTDARIVVSRGKVGVAWEKKGVN